MACVCCSGQPAVLARRLNGCEPFCLCRPFLSLPLSASTRVRLPPCRSPQQQALRVQVWDPGSAAEDCSLGCAAVDLAPLCDGQTHELDLQLFCSGDSSDSGADEEGCSADAGGDGSSAIQHNAAAAGSSPGSRGQQQEPCGSLQLHCRFFSFAGALAQGAAADSEMGPPVVGIPGQIPLAADWREVLELAGVAAHAMFKPVAYIENATTDTEAWVYWNEEQGAACVAFRGTEQGKWRDILTDLHLVPAPLDPTRVAEAPKEAALAEVSQPPEEPGRLSRILSTVEQAKAQVAAERAQQEEEQSSQEQAERHILATAANAVISTAEDLKAILGRVRAEIDAAEQRGAEQEAAGGEPQPWVHSGFLTAYDSVRPAVLSVLSTLLEGEAPRTWRLFLTGHSLGGALATLCAWDSAHRSWRTQVELEVWNFGCPRVGNRAFAEHYNRLVPSTWRVVNARDTVCTLPRLMGYAHVGHAIQLEPDGGVELIMHSTQQLGEGLSLPDVAPAVSAAVTSSVAAKVPDILPGAAVAALQRVGLEVASAGGEEDEEGVASRASIASASLAEAFEDAGMPVGQGGSGSMAACSSGQSGSASGGSGSGDGSTAPALSPEHLSHLWEQERAAWSLLLDGALDSHMEPQYLAGLRALLEAQRRGQPGGREG
ncbi:hypothetical protein ABPG75_008114 [Micractinium tetrahymenae]